MLAKFPRAGEVKTRLAKTVGNATAVERYTQFLERLIREHRSNTSYDFRVAVGKTEDRSLFAQQFHLSDTQCTAQGEGDLGERLLYVAKEAFQTHQPVFFIGADLPDLSAQDVQEALSALQTHDVVIGPCDDGGYYLIGMNRHVPELFQAISWSTEHVLRETTERAKAAECRVQLLPVRRDIDTEEDLRMFDENGSTRS